MPAVHICMVACSLQAKVDTADACAWLQMTCGTVYGVVPFVSRRSNGVVCGLVSAGGAIGGVLWQAIFFLMVNTTGNSELPGCMVWHLCTPHCNAHGAITWCS